MLNEIVFIEVAEVKCLFVASGGGSEGLVALQPEEELRILTEVQTCVHSFNERINGNVLAVMGKVAVVRKTVQKRAWGPAWVSY